ncbi:MAG: hypothetical protein HGA95_03705, partial [Caldiserica bacterium]|nr:hypothetical protein [Caldisericota bacterium]
SLGALDDLPKNKVRDFERFFIDELKRTYHSVITELSIAPKLTDSIKDEITGIVDKVVKDFRSL